MDSAEKTSRIGLNQEYIIKSNILRYNIGMSVLVMNWYQDKCVRNHPSYGEE